ncbi:hypothetical protein [Henriciella sp.]|uniref:hypothetical protein n=1 Tax=Henriciella sp. TaxID=1968823 RepID=UPI00260D1B49|nr:hypothetical protein [Henriciella sp.]
MDFGTVFIAGHGPGALAWDVTDTGQPYETVEFTLTEGTWISLDVSPDGETIVFDLLGDIYAMPSTGGAARLVHGGPAMQRSPQYSPDGSKIAYISDVDGADNIWTSRPDGGEAIQVSSETSLAVVEPAWSPDGETLAAARMFDTADRLHASELVTYPARGGPGEQIVAMPETGENVHDAVFSPDGEALYFVEKVTGPHPSGIYIDANHKHFAIRRKDIETGNIETVVGGFGGATSPSISPSGDKMAFVRRVRDETMLFVYDFASKTQTPIFDGLDRDGQADFLGQGNYYPRFSWFPDGEDLAVWAGGKILRIGTETGETSEIPFKLTSRHQLTKPVRLTQDLDPDMVQVKAVSKITVSPDRETLAFTALGGIWQQDVAGGEPAKLTDMHASQSEATYSPDGAQLAFVEWDDVSGGELKVRKADGEVVSLFQTAGIVREPVYSPDGSKILFRIAEGDDCLGGTQGGG